MRRGRSWGLAGAVFIPVVLYAYLRYGAYDYKWVAPKGHFYVVSVVALLATLIGIAVGVAGVRLRNVKVTFMAIAFVSLAGMFTVHGISTPGFLLHASHVSGFSAQLSIVLASLWLWLSALSSDHMLVRFLARRKTGLVAVWTLLLIAFGTACVRYSHLADALSLNRSPLKWAATAVVLSLNAHTVVSYYRSYRYSRFPLQYSIICSVCWLSVAQVIVVTGETWRISWWLYHYLLLASMIVMLAGLIRQYAAKRSFVHAVKALFAVDPVERITNSLSPSVKALVLATESRDPHTAGHNFRVTLYALRLAEELGLKPEQLRALAQGAIVHDVGKLAVPDEILNKPGRLTEDERAVIERHAIQGYEMCRNLGFPEEELDIIRSHHERWDGTGYPDRLRGEQIPPMARIVAVADVYDALTSTRSYRQAWTHEEAIRWLKEQRGTHFDPACVDAWVRLCERDPQVYRYPATLANEGGISAATPDVPWGGIRMTPEHPDRTFLHTDHTKSHVRRSGGPL